MICPGRSPSSHQCILGSAAAAPDRDSCSQCSPPFVLRVLRLKAAQGFYFERRRVCFFFFFFLQCFQVPPV